jgi:hypothetical protein
MATATCLACGADVAVVRSAITGLVAVVDGMPSKTAGAVTVDFRRGTYLTGGPGLLHRFHACGYERIVQVRSGVRK